VQQRAPETKFCAEGVAALGSAMSTPKVAELGLQCGLGLQAAYISFKFCRLREPLISLGSKTADVMPKSEVSEGVPVRHDGSDCYSL
jgi:hypothetical protein